MPDEKVKRKINPFTIFETALSWLGYVGAFIIFSFMFGFIPIWSAVNGQDWWQIFGIYIIFGSMFLLFFVGTILTILIGGAYDSMKKNWHRRNNESNS